jgi:hypothetical protein
MATQEQLSQFQNLMQSGDYAGAASLAQSQGYSPQDVTNYINTNPALFGFPSEVPLSAVQPFFSAGTPTTTPTTPTTPVKPTTPSTTTPVTTVTTPTTTPTQTGGSFTQGAPLPNITTTQTQATSAPSWYMDYLSGLAQKSAQAAQGAQYVGASPLQQRAFDLTGQAAGQYAPMLQKGAGFAETAGGAKAYENVGAYMNPYVQDVVKRIGELGQRQIEQNIAPGVTSGLVGAGQFGSKRGAEALGQTLRDVQQNILGQQAQALQSGYTQALAAAQGDLSRQLTAGQQLGALAQAGQGMNIADINALATLGAQQQAIQQNKELFPLQQLANQAAVLRGYAVPTSVSTQYTGPIPGAYAASPLQQIAGIAALLGGLGQTKFGSSAANKIGGWLGKFFGDKSSGGNLTDQDWLNWATSGSSGSAGLPFSEEDLSNILFRDGGAVKKYRHGGDVRGYATAGSVVPSMPSGLGMSGQAQQDYFDEVTKILETLEKKASGEPNWFQVAGALLDPGKTGGAGEALGRASGVIGAKLEKASEAALPLAQARATIAGQRYTLSQNEEAMKALNQLYGGDLIKPSTTPSGEAAPSTTGPRVGTDGGWLPDPTTTKLMLASSGGDAKTVLGDIAKARIKYSEPTDIVKDLTLLQDPNTSAVVKQGIATKYLTEAIKPIDIRTPTGTVQSNALAEIKKLIPTILPGATPSGSVAPTGTAPTTSGGAPSGAPRVSSGAPRDVEMFTTADGFKVPLPAAPPVVKAPSGFEPGSPEALKAMEDQIRQEREFVYGKDGILQKSRARYEAANQNLANFNTVIEATKDIQGGILAAPIQIYDRLIDALGFSNPQQYKRMIATGVVDKTTKDMVAKEIRAAFGGMPTEGERRFLEQSLPNISDPKELILFATYMRRAAALRDIARYEYISQHAGVGITAEKTFDAWNRRQSPLLFEPELKRFESRLGGARPEGRPTPSARPPVYLGNREIIPNDANTGWVYKDDGTPVK